MRSDAYPSRNTPTDLPDEAEIHRRYVRLVLCALARRQLVFGVLVSKLLNACERLRIRAKLHESAGDLRRETAADRVQDAIERVGA